MDRENFVLKDSVDLVHRLSADDQPEWGRMSAQHMIEHLGILFMISGGRIEPKGLPEEKQREYYEKLMSGDFRFKPNTRSPSLPENPLPLRFDGLQEAKQAAFKGLNHFKEYFKEAPDAKVEHPVFGPLTYEEWLLFHDMHLKHHFRQFGLISKK